MNHYSNIKLKRDFLPHPIITPIIGVANAPLHMERGRRVFNCCYDDGVRLQLVNDKTKIYEKAPFLFSCSSPQQKPYQLFRNR